MRERCEVQEVLPQALAAQVLARVALPSVLGMYARRTGFATASATSPMTPGILRTSLTTDEFRIYFDESKFIISRGE